jgi:hypothetical protein
MSSHLISLMGFCAQKKNVYAGKCVKAEISTVKKKEAAWHPEQ